MTRAVVFIPAADLESTDSDLHTARCLEYCQEMGYEFRGLIHDNWEAAKDMAMRGETSVVIVSSEEHLPPVRKPRIEVVANRPAPSRWEERTRVIRRSAAR